MLTHTYFLFNKDILPCSEPIKNGLHIYKEKTNKFTEGIIWTYEGVCKFLDHFEKTSDIDGPIDTRIHVYSEIYGGLIFIGHIHHLYIKGLYQVNLILLYVNNYLNCI